MTEQTKQKRIDNRERHTTRRRGVRIFTQTMAFNLSPEQFDFVEASAIENKVSKGAYLRSLINADMENLRKN